MQAVIVNEGDKLNEMYRLSIVLECYVINGIYRMFFRFVASPAVCVSSADLRNKCHLHTHTNTKDDSAIL